MKPERWQLVKQLCNSALEYSASERAVFLDQACDGDEALRREVETLLAHEEEAEHFIEAPAVEVAAKELARDSAPSLVGRQVGHYQVLSLLGAGGMGEVYLARDTRLDRTVALKILPASVASDQDRMRRFVREARAASALNHPNVATIHDVGEADGVSFIVMENVEGQTLSAMIGDHACEPDEIIRIGLQIADALGEAHARGITHRDIKPANIMLTARGQVKVLDFGLAKIARTEGQAAGSETATALSTTPGLVMGTVQYMSPEQVLGREVDHRSDIFSLGVVLYQMATGRRPFDRPTPAETMAAILRDEPPKLTQIGKNLAPELERMVTHCLAKEPEARYQSARDLHYDLSALAGGSGILKASVARSTSRFRSAMLVGISAALVIAGLAVAAIYVSRGAGEKDPIKFNISLEGMTTITTEAQNSHLAVSPDGRRLAFVVLSGGRRVLWVRPRDGISVQPLDGTENAYSPFWSPDSRWIGFFADGKLRKINASGGPVQSLCDVPTDVGSGTWSRHGIILFGGEGGGREGLYKVSDAGGEITLVVKPDHPKEAWYFWPNFLPDGRHFLYLASNEESKGGILYAGSLDSVDKKPLLEISSHAEYVSPGYLLYVRDGTLMVQPFDAEKLSFTGEAAKVAEKIQYFSPTGWALFAAAENLLAYQSGEVVSRLVWFDRNGRELNSVGPPANHESPRISPDGQRVAVGVADPRTGTLDIWVYELKRDLPTRFTHTDSYTEYNPIWSPNGSEIAFVGDTQGPPHLHKKAWGGAGDAEILLPPGGVQWSHDWSLDGRFILYEENDPRGKIDLWILPTFGDRKPRPFCNTPSVETEGRFSPDGHWIAYVSDDSGRRDVYVQSFQFEGRANGVKWRVSTAGGSQPVWRRDGKELFYLAPDNKLMSVPVKSGTTFEAGSPTALFRIEPSGGGGFYDVTADGQKFLVNTSVTRADSLPITVVVNWTASLKR